MNRETIIQEISKRRTEIEKFGVFRLGLFGSYGRDEGSDTSDIDFLVEFRLGQKNFDNLMNLKFFLEKIFPGKKIDLVLKEKLKPGLRAGILSEVQYAS